jgi:hypothetical protein
MESSDAKQVTINTTNPAAYDQNAIVEVIGLVENNTTLNEIAVVPFDSKFDLANYDKIVSMANGKHSAIFQP